MVEVEIPQSLFEEQGRQFYGARLLEIQASVSMTVVDLYLLLSFTVTQIINARLHGAAGKYEAY